MFRIRTLAIATLALVAVSACKKKDAVPAADTSVAMTPPPPPAPSVSALELGRHLSANKRVTDTTSTFAPRDTFYLAVMTENTAPGASLTAKWTFQTGQLVDSTTQAVAAADAASPVSVTEFHVAKPKGWPVGTYKVEVWLDGMSTGTREFAVRR